MEEQKKPSLWTRLWNYIKRHRIIFTVIASILVVAIAAAATFLVLSHKPTPAVKPNVVVKKAPPVTPPKYYSPLTGELVANQAATLAPVTAVMIENSPDARPQSGLKNSGIVFEAIAEGGITRFLVLYQAEKPQLIGPVRSIRLYDVDWLAAFNASVAHVGGSAAALAEVRNGNYRDIDQFFNGGSYWRSTDRYAPHNVYTSFAKLDALNAAKGYTTSTFTSFPRVDGAPSKTPNATQINITISSPLYNSTYAYDAATNTYLRSQAGAPHLDREDGQIAPSSVIALHVTESTVMQDGDREDITTIGSGAATIFQNGTAQDVTWHKASPTGQLSFTDSEGKDVALVRGQTWIAAIPSDGGAVSWK